MPVRVTGVSGWKSSILDRGMITKVAIIMVNCHGGKLPKGKANPSFATKASVEQTT